MKECHRILKPGGVVTVIVPDQKVISLAYLTGQLGNWQLNGQYVLVLSGIAQVAL